MFDETTRLVADEAEAVTMEGVEHLGQYVFEMTNTRIKQLQAEQSGPSEPTIEEESGDEGTGGYYDQENDQENNQDVEPDIQEVREGEA